MKEGIRRLVPVGFVALVAVSGVGFEGQQQGGNNPFENPPPVPTKYIPFVTSRGIQKITCGEGVTILDNNRHPLIDVVLKKYFMYCSERGLKIQ